MVEFRRKQRKILEFVDKVRLRQRWVGTRKLHRMMRLSGDEDLKIGRDRLFELLANPNRLIKRKRRHISTTNFKHDKPIYPNLLEGLETERINQAWVVDITYLNTCEGFAYLFLLTDLHSRRILAHAVADNMKTENACLVLEKALTTVYGEIDLIHHSDHGSQYCSDAYQSILNTNKIRCSMTGQNRCYDNAVAERMNGILKQEFGLNKTFVSVSIAREAAREAIDIYNNERLHVSLGYRTPESVYHRAA